MNTYNKIIEAFVDLRPSAGREWKGKPFVIGDKALYAADLLGVDKIIITRQEPVSCTVMEFSDVEILLMPVVNKEYDDEDQLITIL